jgi:nicotinamide riboside kinase
MKIVLTGGPSGGKTTLAGTLQKEFSEKVLIVPEAASMLFSGGFPRRPGLKSVSHRQKAIYYIQRELEALTEDEKPEALLICDRGSLDGNAYWPDPDSLFLDAVHSTYENECARYEWVIHLDTAPQHFYDLTNALRIESYEEAVALNNKIKESWSRHPQRFVIDNTGHFVDKLYRATLVIEQILAGRTYQEIQSQISSLQI